MVESQASLRLFRVVVPVRDLTRGVSFYADLLGNSGKQVSPGRHYFDCGGVTLCIYAPRADGDEFDLVPNPTPLYLATSDLEAMYERAKSSGCADLEPSIKTRPWGERSFYAKDPFGNPLCFVEQGTMFSGQFFVE